MTKSRVRLHKVVSTLQERGYKLSVRAVPPDHGRGERVTLHVLIPDANASGEKLVAEFDLNNYLVGSGAEDRLWDQVRAFSKSKLDQEAAQFMLDAMPVIGDAHVATWEQLYHYVEAVMKDIRDGYMVAGQWHKNTPLAERATDLFIAAVMGTFQKTGETMFFGKKFRKARVPRARRAST